MTRPPNFLILMVDQMAGTLCPDGPADFLHVPNLKALAERSLRFANCYTASPLCVPARAAATAEQPYKPARRRQLKLTITQSVNSAADNLQLMR